MVKGDDDIYVAEKVYSVPPLVEVVSKKLFVPSTINTYSAITRNICKMLNYVGAGTNSLQGSTTRERSLIIIPGLSESLLEDCIDSAMIGMNANNFKIEIIGVNNASLYEQEMMGDYIGSGALAVSVSDRVQSVVMNVRKWMKRHSLNFYMNDQIPTAIPTVIVPFPEALHFSRAKMTREEQFLRMLKTEEEKDG